MMIIDSQVHIWAPETLEKPYLREDASPPHRPVPLGHDKLLSEMDNAGVARCILVPPTWEGNRNDTSLEAARLYPNRFRIMGKLALTNPNGPALMATWNQQPHMLGIRMTFNAGRARQWIEDGTADWFWHDCERYDIPIMIFAPFAVAAIGKIAERHPGLRVIVDHMGLNVQWKGKDLTPGVDLLLTFARLPNVAVKASCLPCYVAEPYPFPTLHPQIHRVVDAFGVQRVMWGTDLSQSPVTYRQNVTLFTEELKFLSASDKEWIMGKSLAHWLRWSV